MTAHRIRALAAGLMVASLLGAATQNRLAAPLHFEPNHGQFDEHVRFAARGAGHAFFISGTEAVAVLRSGSEEGSKQAVVRIRFPGSGEPETVEGLDPLPGRVNHLVGEASGWIRDISIFGRVRAAQVYPGVDLIYYGNEKRLEFDLDVAPGADPGAIRLAYTGVDAIEVNDAGDLVLHTLAGDLVQRRPVARHQGREIAASYSVGPDSVVAIALGDYDPAVPLTIDPVLEYSTYFGGTANEYPEDIIVDDAGNLYVAGYSMSTDYPAVPVDGFPTDTPDIAFVTKFAPDGGSLVYSTYFGGNDHAFGIALASDGSVWVTGNTRSTDFRQDLTISPVPGQSVPGCAEINESAGDVFVIHLNAAGDDIPFSACYAAWPNGGDGRAIHVDAAGNIYVAGETSSSQFYTTPGAFQEDPNRDPRGWIQDLFVFKTNPATEEIFYSTYVGSAHEDYFGGFGVASDGSAVVFAKTFGISVDGVNNFPTTTGALSETPHELQECILARLNPTGTGLIYGTFFGGSESDYCTDMVVKPDATAFVTGYTESTDLYLAAPGVDKTKAGSSGAEDGFAAKVDPDGNLEWCTYLGDAGVDYIQGIGIDGQDSVYVAGYTESTEYLFGPSYQRVNNGLYDALLWKITPAGDGFWFKTYLGATGREYVDTMAVGDDGAAYVAGRTESQFFPTTPEAYDRTFGGSWDGFLFKMRESADLSITKSADINPVLVGETLTYTYTVRNYGPDYASGVTVVDSLPAALNVVSCEATGGGVCSNDGNDWTISYDSFAAETVSTITVVTTIKAGTAVGTVLHNSATVGAAYSGDPNTGNNTATEDVTVAVITDVTIASNSTGMAFQADSATYATPHTFQWRSSSQHTVSFTTPQNESGGMRQIFSQWNDATTSSSRSITVPVTATTYTGSFINQYYLTTTATAGGGISPGSAWYNSGAVVEASATPDGTHRFTGFSGALTGTTTPQDVTMNAAKSVQANFALKLDPVITWSNPADIVDGTPLGATQLNATANVAGTFVYDPPSGTVLPIGDAQQLSVTFTPTDTANYNAATDQVLINVIAEGGGKTDPVITWSNPVAITYPAALGAVQLNATANVAGTFAYNPPSGTVLNAGAGQVLSVTFTPTDTTNYNTAQKQVTIDVLKADPVVTWATPAAITYPTPLNGQLNATADIPGTFVYNPPTGTVLNAGAGQALSVTFTPTDTTNYNTAQKQVTITVNKADPVVTWATPAAITYPTPLSGQLNATADVPGTFVYNPPTGTVLNAGAGQVLSATFTPTDATNYNTAQKQVSITVYKADPVITWPNPADITNPAPLGAAELNATANVPGTFLYNPPAGTVLLPGDNQVLNVAFTPTDTANYDGAQAQATINVLPPSGSAGKINPVITWPAPAAVIYATPLGPSQLNATADVEGAFVYGPPAAKILEVGTGHVLKVTFTPNDTDAYNTVMSQVTLDVQAAPPATPPRLLGRVIKRADTEDPEITEWTRIWTMRITNYGSGMAIRPYLVGAKIKEYVTSSAEACPITFEPVFPMALENNLDRRESEDIEIGVKWPTTCSPPARVNIEFEFAAQGYVGESILYNQVR